MRYPDLVLDLARKRGVERRLEEFLDDPLLTIACLALIGVCLMWIVISRLISRNVRRAAQRGDLRLGEVKPPKDIWSEPP